MKAIQFTFLKVFFLFFVFFFKFNIFHNFKGVEFMLYEKYFEEAYILHDFTSYQILLQQLLEHSDLIFKNDESISKVSIFYLKKSIEISNYYDILFKDYYSKKL